MRPVDQTTVVLDNIPFYAKGIVPGDVLSVSVDRNGDIWYDHVRKPGGASVFRIHLNSDLKLAQIMEELLDLGVPNEVDTKVRLIEVELSRS